MTVAVFTIFEDWLTPGVVALHSSLIKSGFTGKFVAFHKGSLSSNSKAILDELSQAPRRCIHLQQIHQVRHSGYHKPFLGREVFDSLPEIDAVVYADPDVAVICPWSFVEDWIRSGIALCVDLSFPSVPEHHPWRREWARMVQSVGAVVQPHKTDYYYNSGFFGIQRAHVGLLQAWMSLTINFELGGGDSTRFHQSERFRSVTGDQDLLAAALMMVAFPISTIGLEGMGFSDHFFILAHATESPKPWRGSHTVRALHGIKPSTATKLWLANYRSIGGKFQACRNVLRAFDMCLASFITRLWRRG